MKGIMYLISSLFLIMAPVAGYARVSVSLDLDRTQAYHGKGVGDSVRLVVTTSGTKSCDDRPRILGLAPFDVSGGGSSSRVEIVNGQYGTKLQHTYFLQPTDTGTFTIGPARVKVEGKVYESNTQELQVIEAPASEVPRASIFLTADLSTHRAFVEQQVLYILKLHLRERVSDLSLTLPETDDLTFKQLGKPREYRQTHNGRQYVVVEIRYALISAAKGTFDIAPAKIDLTVYEASRRRHKGLFNDPFFDDPFFKTGRPLQVESAPLRFEVCELPAKGRPADFSGMVGALHMESSLTPARIRVGESATLTVKLEGKGNVNRMPDPSLPEIKGIKVYADEPTFTITPDEEGLTGLKVMKWALVPEGAGTHQIPDLATSFFDVTQKRYETIRTRPRTLKVLPAKRDRDQTEAPTGRARETAAGSSKREDRTPVKQEVKEIGQDILPIHTSVRDMGHTYSSHRPVGLVLWIVLAVPFAAYVAVFTGLRLKRRSIRSMPALRAKKAIRNFLKAYGETPHDPLARMTALRNYMNDRFGLSLAIITPDEAARILISRGVSPDKARALQAAFQRIEDAIYGGKEPSGTTTRDPVPALIKQIEKELP